MAISFAERRGISAAAQARNWHPFGPLQFPPFAEYLAEEHGLEEGVKRFLSLRRSHSWSGFRPSRSPAEDLRVSFRTFTDCQASREENCDTIAHFSGGECLKTDLALNEDMSMSPGVAVDSNPSERTPTETGARIEPCSCGEGSQTHEERGVDHRAAGAGSERECITTYMVQNLKRSLNRRDFVAILNGMGLEGHFDYVHLPKSFDCGRNKGFAFVNFTTVEAAEAFAGRFGSDGESPAPAGKRMWRVVPAAVQGYEANAANVGSKKVRRVRNSACRPVVLGGRGASSMACPKDPVASSMARPEDPVAA
mmetsp:Transcript_39900/g.125594  ORF Transcript_39900/g.125594 Transcript_39900/m.125594 type:complete len:309 (+) Transcript_39900:94-1020(+)